MAGSRRCEQCGAAVPADDSFCGKCGATIAPPEPPPAAPALPPLAAALAPEAPPARARRVTRRTVWIGVAVCLIVAGVAGLVASALSSPTPGAQPTPTATVSFALPSDPLGSLPNPAPTYCMGLRAEDASGGPDQFLLYPPKPTVGPCSHLSIGQKVSGLMVFTVPTKGRC